MTDPQRRTARRYDEAFRAAAVEQARAPGATIGATAASLGVSASTLRRWVRAQTEAEAAGTADPPPPAPVEAQAREPAPEPEPAETSDANRAAQLHLDPEAEWQVAPGHEAQESLLLPSDDIFPALARLVPAYRFPILLVALLAAVAVSVAVPADYPGRPTIVALHVVSLVVSFGAVLVIDWHGILWLLGLRQLAESTRLAAATGPVIWAGLAGLIASGALLHPDLSSPLTILKLFLVLAVAWNGAAMSVFRRRLARLPPTTKPAELPKTDWRILAISSTISQVGWWGAIIIGFINSGRG